MLESNPNIEKRNNKAIQRDNDEVMEQKGQDVIKIVKTAEIRNIVSGCIPKIKTRSRIETKPELQPVKDRNNEIRRG